MSAPESWHVSRTMRALELLAFSPASAAEVAHQLQVHPRTARRMLSRLVTEGYLRLIESDRSYEPTMRLVALAGQIVERSALARVAAAHVQRLHERIGATAHLGVPSYDSVLCLVHVDPETDDGIEPHLRELVPCHCSAGGKALLAWRHEWRRDVLSRPLKRYTDRTLVDVNALENQATRVRLHGYSTEDGEFRVGARAVGAPVFSEHGDPVAALWVSASATELTDLEATGQEVVTAAGALSAALGFSLQEPPQTDRMLRLA